MKMKITAGLLLTILLSTTCQAGDMPRAREDAYLRALERLEQRLNNLQHQLDALSHNPTFQSVTISNSTGPAILTVSDPLRSVVITPKEIVLSGLPGFLSHIRIVQTGNTPISGTNTLTFNGKWLICDAPVFFQRDLVVRSNITAGAYQVEP